MTQIPPQPPPQQPPPPVYREPSYNRRKGGGLPLAALILGITAIIPILGVALGLIAVVLGIISLVQKRPKQGMSIAAIVLGFALPTLATATTVQVYQAARQAEYLANRIKCGSHLRTTQQGAQLYFEDYGVIPADLNVLVKEKLVPAEALRCPSADAGREVDYFYHPPDPDSPKSTVVACDLKDNHKDGRNVVRRNATVSFVSEQEFQELLKKPENADFSLALREAEGP